MAKHHLQSFIAPVLESLDGHVGLEKSHAQARIRASAYRALKRQIDGLRALQELVDQGRALDQTVLDELLRSDESSSDGRRGKGGLGVLEGSKVLAGLKIRKADLRQRVDRSANESWGRAVKFEASAGGGKVEVQRGVQVTGTPNKGAFCAAAKEGGSDTV